MSIIQPNVDYTTKDFASLRLRLQGLARSVFPQWTDHNTPQFGTILLELYAFTGDITTFYQDNQARDLYWPTVQQRENAIRLGRQINFTLASARQASASERFSVPAAVTVAVPIPLGTKLRTADETSLPFRTTVAGEIAVGNSFVDLEIEQAALITGEGFASTGAPSQRYTTIQSPVIDRTTNVTAADGTYLEIDSFLDPDPLTNEAVDQNSKVFLIRINAFDQAQLLFGNGQVGKIPEGSVDLTYKTGGGLGGNVDAGEIRILEDSLIDLASNIAPVSVTNPLRASGGVDRVSVAQARSQGPASLRVLERSVTKEDFEIGALEVPGVARAVMVTSNQDAAVPENTGIIFVVAKGEQLPSGRVAPAVPSQTILDEVLNKVTVVRPHTLTFIPTTEAAPLREIDHSTRIFVSAGKIATEVGASVRASINDFYAAQLANGTPNPDIDFGANITQADGTVISELAWSDVLNAIRDTEGVRKVDEGPQGLLLNGLRSSVTLGPRDFPVVGTIQVIDGDTGAAI